MGHTNEEKLRGGPSTGSRNRFFLRELKFSGPSKDYNMFPGNLEPIKLLLVSRTRFLNTVKLKINKKILNCGSITRKIIIQEKLYELRNLY